MESDVKVFTALMQPNIISLLLLTECSTVAPMCVDDCALKPVH